MISFSSKNQLSISIHNIRYYKSNLYRIRSIESVTTFIIDRAFLSIQKAVIVENGFLTHTIANVGHWVIFFLKKIADLRAYDWVRLQYWLMDLFALIFVVAKLSRVRDVDGGIK